jgi:uncharacterized protein YneF (UPF0154 family)
MNAQALYLFIILLCLAFNAIIGYYILNIICRKEQVVLPEQMVSASTVAGIKMVP